MAQIYSGMDLLVNPAHGEGFGLAPLEAAACGVPSVATKFSAMPQVVGPGWLVGCEPEWTGQLSWQAKPDTNEILAAFEECHAMSKGKRAELSTRCRNHALNYSAPKVYAEYFRPALEEVFERYGLKAPALEAVA
jgi:glycosyltransferase involved in cell wall biosynthesis